MNVTPPPPTPSHSQGDAQRLLRKLLALNVLAEDTHRADNAYATISSVIKVGACVCVLENTNMGHTQTVYVFACEFRHFNDVYFVCGEGRQRKGEARFRRHAHGRNQNITRQGFACGLEHAEWLLLLLPSPLLVSPSSPPPLPPPPSPPLLPPLLSSSLPSSLPSSLSSSGPPPQVNEQLAQQMARGGLKVEMQFAVGGSGGGGGGGGKAGKSAAGAAGGSRARGAGAKAGGAGTGGAAAGGAGGGGGGGRGGAAATASGGGGGGGGRGGDWGADDWGPDGGDDDWAAAAVAPGGGGGGGGGDMDFVEEEGAAGDSDVEIVEVGGSSALQSVAWVSPSGTWVCRVTKQGNACLNANAAPLLMYV